MTRKLRGVFGVLLGLALVLGLVPGVVATALADDDTTGTMITADTTTLTEGTYYISANTTLNGGLIVSEGKVIINLNGHSLSQAQQQERNSVIRVTGGELTVNNGTITGGQGGYDCRGGGFHVSGGAVTVNDVTITDNTASWGGGVYMAGGSFTMNNSHIDANHSVTDEHDWHDGGGAYLDGGIFTMNDGTIQNNTVTANKKNGLVLANSSARLNISGNAIIYNNMSTDGETQQNLHADALFGGASPLYVTGQLGKSAKIGITSALDQVFTSSENTDLNDPTKFVSDNSGYRIARNGDGQLMLAQAGAIIADAGGYKGAYDKEGHGITVTAIDPAADECTITYGETEGNYNLTQSPVYVDAGTYTVYYKIEASNYTTKTGTAQVVIGPADNPASVTGTASVVRGGNTVDLASNVTMNGATGNVSYEFDGDDYGCSLDGSVLRSGNDVGSVTVNVTVSEDGNYKPSDLMPITVTIGDKKAQTITASNVTATYGDTGKRVSATTDGDGKISYAVKEGADVVGVDASTGALTIKKVGTATVTVTAAETSTCKQETKDVTVTIAKKAAPTPAEAPPVSVTAHVQRKGTLAAVSGGAIAGTTGKSLRMESIKLTVDGASETGGIEYRSHVQGKGWERSWAKDGAMAGTEGKSRRLEAVQIRLSGAAKDNYDVYYRVHVQRLGWMGWAKNGESAGTQGMSRRAEAIQVVLVAKDAPAPATDFQGATQAYAKAFAKK